MYELMRSVAISDILAPSHEHGGGSSELGRAPDEEEEHAEKM